MESFLGTKLITNDGKEADFSRVKDAKVIGIYFSAHWCPPCRNFTPILASFYEEVNANEHQLEIIFASRDKDENSFNEYFATMPWLAFPFDDERISKFKNLYDVTGIPKLVIINKEADVITLDGRNDVVNVGPEAVKKWL